MSMSNPSRFYRNEQTSLKYSKDYEFGEYTWNLCQGNEMEADGKCYSSLYLACESNKNDE